MWKNGVKLLKSTTWSGCYRCLDSFIVRQYLMVPSGKPIKNPIPYSGGRFRVYLLNVIPFFLYSAPTNLLLLYALLRGLKGCPPQLKRRVSDDCKIHQHSSCVLPNCLGHVAGPLQKLDIVIATLLLSDEHSTSLWIKEKQISMLLKNIQHWMNYSILSRTFSGSLSTSPSSTCPYSGGRFGASFKTWYHSFPFRVSLVTHPCC